jgi:hypothetical protein
MDESIPNQMTTTTADDWRQVGRLLVRLSSSAFEHRNMNAVFSIRRESSPVHHTGETSANVGLASSEHELHHETSPAHHLYDQQIYDSYASPDEASFEKKKE